MEGHVVRGHRAAVADSEGGVEGRTLTDEGKDGTSDGTGEGGETWDGRGGAGVCMESDVTEVPGVVGRGRRERYRKSVKYVNMKIEIKQSQKYVLFLLILNIEFWIIKYKDFCSFRDQITLEITYAELVIMFILELWVKRTYESLPTVLS